MPLPPPLPLQEALFDQLTELLAAALSQSSADRGQSVRLLLEKVSEIHSTVLHHLAKEEEQLFPLLLANFSHAEQAQLVAEFFCSIPLAAVDSVLAWLKPSVPPQEQQELMQQVRGVVSDELLGRLLAAWLRQKHDAPESSGAGEGSAGQQQQQQQQEEQQQGKDQPPPVLLLHHIHAAIRLALKEFVEETSALEAAAAKGGPGAGLGQQNGADSLASLFEQYRFLRAMCTFHSSSENETVLCAQRLEGAQQQGEEGAAGASAAAGGGGGGGHLHLHHPHGGDHHESGSADFDALGRLLADVRSCARRGNKRAAVLATELRRSAEAVRSSVDEHMREEEAEAIPLLASDCSVVEQRQLVWNTIRGMPLRLLESMLPWVASQVSLLRLSSVFCPCIHLLLCLSVGVVCLHISAYGIPPHLRFRVCSTFPPPLSLPPFCPSLSLSLPLCVFSSLSLPFSLCLPFSFSCPLLPLVLFPPSNKKYGRAEPMEREAKPSPDASALR